MVMNRMLSQINNTLCGAACWFGGSCLGPRQQNTHNLLQSTCWQTCSPSMALKTTPQCCYTLGFPGSFVNGGYSWVKSCNHILARDDHQCSFRGHRNDDSEGQGVTIPGQPFSPWRTMEHLFLPSVFTLSLGCDRAGVCLASIWPPVTESRPIWCLLPLYCLCWKTKTPELLHSVDLTKERGRQCVRVLFMLSQPLVHVFLQSVEFPHSALLLKTKIWLQWRAL